MSLFLVIAHEAIASPILGAFFSREEAETLDGNTSSRNRIVEVPLIEESNATQEATVPEVRDVALQFPDM
jgi:hypothetical protein